MILPRSLAIRYRNPKVQRLVARLVSLPQFFLQSFGLRASVFDLLLCPTIIKKTDSHGGKLLKTVTSWELLNLWPGQIFFGEQTLSVSSPEFRMAEEGSWAILLIFGDIHTS